jgi:hypothetical protein
MLGVGAIGCNDFGGSQPLPAGTSDPSSYATPEGARGMRNAAVYQFELAIPQFIVDVGLLTDELEDQRMGVSSGTRLPITTVVDPLDERILIEQPKGMTTLGNDPAPSYGALQSVREYANQAIGALAAYDTVAADIASARVLRSELYAIEGYAEVMLADLFCSGVPLSTLDFTRDYTFHPSSTTEQVYRDAIAKFDTALQLAVGNDSIMNLARVGRGRAWLDLGQYDSAAAAVQNVPVDFHYTTFGNWCGGMVCDNNILVSKASVSDSEGIMGLPFRSSGDPRSATVTYTFQYGETSFIRFAPKKYQAGLTGHYTSPIVVADGIEAQLIVAEAQLQPASSPSGPWLQTLNTLRESAGLSDTTDPGTTEGRIRLLFSERAEWLFVTGHRQGDLRRLIRNYGPSVPIFQDESRVYPIGAYAAPGSGLYGSDVTAPIPPTEYYNSLYHGCLNRDA